MRIELKRILKNRFFLIILLTLFFIPLFFDFLDPGFLSLIKGSELPGSISQLNQYKDDFLSYIIVDNIYFIFIFLPIAVIDDFKNPLNYTVLSDKNKYWLNKLIVLILVSIILYIIIVVSKTMIINTKIVILNQIYETEQMSFININFYLDKFMLSIFIVLVMFVLLIFSNNIVVWYLLSIVTSNIFENNYIAYGILPIVAIIIYMVRRKIDD